MENIEFRVWNGMEMVYDVMVGKFGIFYVNPSNNGIDENDSACLTPANTKYPDDIPVMQFTGLKDKNGVKIYEGDIFQYRKHDGYWPDAFIGVVRFEEECFGYDIITEQSGISNEFHPFSYHDELKEDFLDHIEIIGSIHDKHKTTMICTKIKDGIVCIGDDSFHCPHCGKVYNDEKYCDRIDKNKSGYTRIYCSCGKPFNLFVDTFGICHGVMTFKQIKEKYKQKQALIDTMLGDEKIGLYDDNSKNHGYER